MYVTPSTPSTLTNPTIERVINLLIDVGNSFNFEHCDKFNFSRLVNLSIDVGNSFNFEHRDKFNFSRLVNLSIHVSNSFNYEHSEKFRSKASQFVNRCR
jgi:hypothetical protein